MLKDDSGADDEILSFYKHFKEKYAIGIFKTFIQMKLSVNKVLKCPFKREKVSEKRKHNHLQQISFDIFFNKVI